MKAILTVDGEVLRGSLAVKYQGDDVAVLITIRAAGAAVNIDNLTELHGYIKLSGTTVKQFSKAGAGDDDALVKVSTTSYRLDWLSADTAEADPGEYTLELNVVESNADYASSEKNTILSSKCIDLQSSLIKDESS